MREIIQMQTDLGETSPNPTKLNLKSPNPSKKNRKRLIDTADTETENGGDQSTESPSKQLVLYESATSDAVQDGLAENNTPSLRNFIGSHSGRILPSIGAFTVQCAKCFKWRLIPTKEKYEEIRETILQEPFVCDRAREWRPDVSCEDPTDISQDGSRLWAIDKPNIAQPPAGWERLLRIRGEGSTKFADVYYATPSGKKLRSMVEVQRYLDEHPEYVSQGVKLSQFSFQIPRPLQENYVRKRPAAPARLPGSSDRGAVEKPLEPEEVKPISWAAPTHKEIEAGGSDLSPPDYEKAVLSHPDELPPPPASELKETGSSSKETYNAPINDQPKSKLENAERSRNDSSCEL